MPKLEYMTWPDITTIEDLIAKLRPHKERAEYLSAYLGHEIEVLEAALEIIHRWKQRPEWRD